jgi:uncharacterized protein HemY
LRAPHYITIAVSVSLVAVLYFGGNTIPPLKKQDTAMQRPSGGEQPAAMPNAVKVASIDSIIKSARTGLSKASSDTIVALEKQITTIGDSSQMVVLFTRISRVWENSKQYPVAAFFTAKAAKLEKSEKKLTFAGQLFLELMEHENSASVQAWEAREAVSCLEQSLKINPDNEETKLALATALIEGAGEPMKGVQILLAITKEKPDDIPANMLLGRMSIQSGQFDKAIGRFETVLKKEADHKEALYFLSQAYEGKGDKKKAIEMLEKCKIVVNNPEFSRDIDQHINSLK